MIVVTTPTGDIGSRVLAQVLDAERPVRVVARDPSKLPGDVRSRVEIVEGSHSDAATIERALDGASAVFWLPPGDPTARSAHDGYVEFSRPFTDALPSSGVGHVVGVSALGRGWPKPAGLVTASIAMDDMIGASGVAYRALACASLTDNVLRQADLIRDQGVFYAPQPGDLELPLVAKSDVARIAAGLLVDPDWRGVEDVPLFGPEDVSHDEMAAIMANVLGKPVRFEAMPMAAFEGMLASMDTSEGMVRDYAAMMVAKNEGMDTVTPPRLRANTPTTFRQWCERELKPALDA